MRRLAPVLVLSPILVLGSALALALVLATVFSIGGCGSGDGGIGDWLKPTTSAVLVNIEGQVMLPVPGAANLAAVKGQASAGPGAAGAIVFVEDKPELTATADQQGRFLLRNVPTGKYHLIAELNQGTIISKQRSDMVSLTGEVGTLHLMTPLQLVPATFRTWLYFRSQAGGVALTGVNLTLWGRPFTTDANGGVNLGPVPSGVWPVKVQTTGYYDRSLLIGFIPNRQQYSEIYLTPLTAADRNQGPVVEVEKGFATLRTNESGNLSAVAFDPDGDLVSFDWIASAGVLSATKGQNIIFTAPAEPGLCAVGVSGQDGKGGFGRCLLEIDVVAGGYLPNPNNHNPNGAVDPYPSNQAQGQGIKLTLTWKGSDPDGDTLNYDVFLGESGQSMKQIATQSPDAFQGLSGLKLFTAYFWKIVSHDRFGGTSQNDPTWQFTTGDGLNRPPNLPRNPIPADLAVGQLPSLLLSWQGGDPDTTDVPTYEVWIGSDPQQLALASTTSQLQLPVTGLEAGKMFSWRVVARDSAGGVTFGDIWRFETFGSPNRPPAQPSPVLPASGAISVALQPRLAWQDEDPDGDPISYDVFLGEKFPLKAVAKSLDTPYYTLTKPLKATTGYFWQVLARDIHGAMNPTPAVWAFTTQASANNPPNIPVAIAPADGETQVAPQAALAWQGGDPDGDTVYYDILLDQASPPAILAAQNIYAPYWAAQTALLSGQVYFWQVIAHDGRGGETRSRVNRFTTYATLDSQAPRLVSVSPTGGSTGISRSSTISFAFSEPMNEPSVESNISLIPAVAGSFIWDSPSFVRFWPTAGWASGSFQVVTMATGTMRDANGNLLAGGSTWGFTVVSDLPLPENMLSAGFSLAAGPGQPLSVPVPNLPVGKQVKVALVGKTATSVLDIGADRGLSLMTRFRETPEAAFRIIEAGLPPIRPNRAMYLLKKKENGPSLQTKPDASGSFGIANSVVVSNEGRNLFRQEPSDRPELLSRYQLTAVAAPSPALAPIGSVRDFYIPAYQSVATTTPFPKNVISAICLGATDKIQIFADKGLAVSGYDRITDLRSRFEEIIQPRLNEYLGAEPETGPDGDYRLTLLFTDAMDTGVFGLFNAADLFANTPGDHQLQESNQRKIIYVRYSNDDKISFGGAVAHEFAHLIQFWQKRSQTGVDTVEEAWLNEGLAMFGEELCGYGPSNGNIRFAKDLSAMETQMKLLSLTLWSGKGNYGLSYLFARYLAEGNRYGTTTREATLKLISTPLTGKTNVGRLTGESFDLTLGGFYVCMLLNRWQVSGLDYGFPNLDLSGTYSGIALPGLTIDTIPSGSTVQAQVSPDGCWFFEKTGNGVPVVVGITNLSSAVNAWFVDERR